jgi:hypothetical protein
MMMRFIALILLLAQQSLMARDAAVPDPHAQQMVQDPVGGDQSMMLDGHFCAGHVVPPHRPQRKKAKELEATLKALKARRQNRHQQRHSGRGAEHQGQTLSIRSADTKLEILKSSVLEVLERAGEPSESKS